MTRGEQLAFAIAYSLRRVRLPRRSLLTEAERDEIAETVIAELRQSGSQWALDEELPRFLHGPSTHGYR